MATNRIFALFYFVTVSLPSAAGEGLSAEFVFDALSRRIDYVIVEVETVKSEIKQDVKRIENRIETIENNVSDLIQQTNDKNNNDGTISVFSEKLKQQSKVFHSMLKTEKAILREKVDHFQDLFHELQTDITSGFAELKVSVGNSIEKFEEIVNDHTAYTNVSLQDIYLEMQTKMNEYETNLAEMSLEITSNKRDAVNKLYEVEESITANVNSNISRMTCEYNLKLSSEMSKVTSKLYEVHRKKCFISGSSEDFKFTKSTTKSGLKCQRWESQIPHKHRYKDEQFTDGSKSRAKDYCRDPGNDGFLWCYTIDPDKRWESCGIPRCDEPARNNNTHDCYIITNKDRESGDSDKEICERKFKEHIVRDCEAKGSVQPGCENCGGCCQTKDCYQFNSRYYTGTWHRGESGRQCQRWDSQRPHNHDYGKSNKFPKEYSVFDAHNYCRDPSSAGFLWCYTEDPNIRWEKCGIPDCYD